MKTNRPTTILLATLMVGLFLTTGCASDSKLSSTARRAAKLDRANEAYAAGVAAEANGDTSAATKNYKRALFAVPDHLQALRRLATLYTADERYADAIPLWKRLVEATDGDADAYNDLGYAYDLAGYVDPAEAAYLRGLQTDPTNTRVRTNFGLMLARHGRTNEAVLQLRSAMPLADAYYNVAVVLESQGKKARARREFQRALDTDPDHIEAELHLAVIDYENGTLGDRFPNATTADVR
jgi:tetratricopeptide (TPR) repeat protein